ncbi:MAG: MATE family efflux transporter [Bacillota bacterium]|nr:MATE family efflux transporter [Bacillota bacterium]
MFNWNKKKKAAEYAPAVKIESRSLYRTLGRVALPIALQSLISSSLSLVDSLMVGSLGETELAAVGIGSQIFMLYWGILFGFTSGSAAFMSQFWGAQNTKSIRKVLGFDIAVCSVIGLVFFISCMFYPAFVMRLFTDIPEVIEMGTGYVRIASPMFLTLVVQLPFTAALRATQQTKVPMFISFAVFGTNTFLNYLLIFGKLGLPALGVNGAATATLIARSLEIFLVMFVIFGRKNLLAGPLREFFDWNKNLCFRVMKSALPVTVNETMWSLGMATFVACYGRTSITEYAAYQAGQNIHSLFIMAAFSLGDALMILVGQRIGMGQMDYAFALTKRLLRIGVCIGGVSGLLLIALGGPLASLFNFTPEGHQYTIYILTIFGCFMWLKLFNGMSITGTFRCGGDTRFAMVAEVSCMWLVGVPLVYTGVFILDVPIYWVVLMGQFYEVVEGCICLARFRSRKWLKNLIQHVE